MFWCKEPSQERLGVEIAGEALLEDFFELKDLELPWDGPISGGLFVSRTINIVISVNKTAESLAVNFLPETGNGDDVWFHWNPRFDRRVVVRNNKRRGSWGEEEIAVGKPFPLVPGQLAYLRFFIFDAKLLVSVNGVHFCEFWYRQPLHYVRRLQLMGDMKVHTVNIHRTEVYPKQISLKEMNMIVPESPSVSSLSIKKSDVEVMLPGTKVHLSGRVKLLPQNMTVNLQVGAAIVPHPVIPFHMNLRLCQQEQTEHLMVYNSWQNGRWEEELRPAVCPFLPGCEFELEIIYLMEGFHISVNGEDVVAFPLRFNSPPEIDTVVVSGDCIVSQLQITSYGLISVTS